MLSAGEKANECSGQEEKHEHSDEESFRQHRQGLMRERGDVFRQRYETVLDLLP